MDGTGKYLLLFSIMLKRKLMTQFSRMFPPAFGVSTSTHDSVTNIVKKKST